MENNHSRRDGLNIELASLYAERTRLQESIGQLYVVIENMEATVARIDESIEQREKDLWISKIRELDLTPTEKLVLLCFAKHCDSSGAYMISGQIGRKIHYVPSYKILNLPTSEIAEDCKLSKGYVSKIGTRLRKLGYIARANRDFRNSGDHEVLAIAVDKILQR